MIDVVPTKSHRVTKTTVVQLENGEYGVEFDDGSKDSAEFYASVQMGEDIVIGVNPLLLNADKAAILREWRSSRLAWVNWNSKVGLSRKSTEVAKGSVPRWHKRFGSLPRPVQADSS
jgi:hypothetical protein